MTFVLCSSTSGQDVCVALRLRRYRVDHRRAPRRVVGGDGSPDGGGVRRVEAERRAHRRLSRHRQPLQRLFLAFVQSAAVQVYAGGPGFHLVARQLLNVFLVPLPHRRFDDRLLVHLAARVDSLTDYQHAVSSPFLRPVPRRQKSPKTLPPSMPIRSAAGEEGRPGIVMMVPARTTTKPAPADTFASRTVI